MCSIKINYDNSKAASVTKEQIKSNVKKLFFKKGTRFKKMHYKGKHNFIKNAKIKF